MSEEARKAADKELERLRMIPPESAEHTVVRTYLDWLVSLPWSITTEDNLDIKHARRGRSTRTITTSKRSRSASSNSSPCASSSRIPRDRSCASSDRPEPARPRSDGRSRERSGASSCVYRSAASVTRPRFAAIAAPTSARCPAASIQGLRNAGSNNPLFILDEVDKLGADFRGDPASALLEVLDPEQNNTFVDHYLDVPFDLSKVLFLTTANMLDTIPHALRDRMEVLELPGYTEEEKLQIVERHLIPKERVENGLGDRQDRVHQARRWRKSSAAIRARPACAISSARSRAYLPQDRAVDHRRRRAAPEQITPEMLRKYLGPPKYFSEVAERTNETGVATGLAWTRRRRRHHFHRKHAHDRAKGADLDRLARRRHEGIGAGRALLHPIARRRASESRRTSSRNPISTSTSRPARFPRTGRRRA